MGEVNKTGSMRYRRLGKTEIRVSELGFGSHLKRVNMEDPEGRRKQIETGIEKGINLFDIYEEAYQQFAPMREALAYVRDEVVISLVAEWPETDKVMDEVEYALRVLDRDVIDLYRAVATGDWDASDQRMEGLTQARDQGKIRAIGCVAHQPEHLLEGLTRYEDVVEYAMMPVSFCAPLVMREDGAMALELKNRDVGVIAIKPMAAADEEGGYIFKLQPESEELAELKQKGMRLGTLAVKFLLQSEVISCVLPAMNSVKEVLQNVRASGDGPLTEEEARFLEIYREEAERVFPTMLREGEYWVTPWKE